VVFEQVRRDLLQDLQLSLLGVVVIGSDADGFDDADAELARDDGCRHQPAAGYADHRLPASVDSRQPPGERPGIAVELVPRNGKGFFGKRHRVHSGLWNAPGSSGKAPKLASAPPQRSDAGEGFSTVAGAAVAGAGQMSKVRPRRA